MPGGRNPPDRSYSNESELLLLEPQPAIMLTASADTNTALTTFLNFIIPILQLCFCIDLIISPSFPSVNENFRFHSVFLSVQSFLHIIRNNR